MSAADWIAQGIWDEESEWVWLAYDQYENAGKAKYAAWTGTGELPFGFREIPVELTELRCRVVYARPGEKHEGGWAGQGEEMWWRCDRSHPKALKFYEVRA